jgi:unsaturated rhamnogalacturonyl hydrolase
MSRWLSTTLVILSFGYSSLIAKAEPAIGVTRMGTEIPVQLPTNPVDFVQMRVVVIGGNDGQKSLITDADNLRLDVAKRCNDKRLNGNREVSLAVIPNVHPDGLPEGMTTDEAVSGYPPKDGFYDHKTHPESRYLWRWLAMYGPDLIVDVRIGKPGFFFVGHFNEDERTREEIRKLLPLEKLALADDDLARQAAEVSLADSGTAPAAVLSLPPETPRGEIIEALVHIIRGTSKRTSISRSFWTIQRRSVERPETVSLELEAAGKYGRDLKQVAYIPSLAVIGRIRFLEHLAKTNKPPPAPEEIVQFLNKQIFTEELLGPYLSGKLNPIPKSGSEQAGHLLFAEMAKRSEGKDRERWIDLCRAAADQILDKDGKPQPLMPYHNEMSDAVFMATPILCATGKLTKEQKYFDAAVTHFRSMKKLCLREDGLYRHSPLDEAAWGRGNGFPAMGLAWALSEFPEDHADFPELKKDFQNHIAALLKHQDVFGCWHQVIDKPGSYREFSATCMIAWALKRGMDRGWLDKKECQPALVSAWIAAKQRIGPKGVVVDICTGTGKQKSLRDYYDRPAVWGVDARGGAMALMLATEMLDSK